MCIRDSVCVWHAHCPSCVTRCAPGTHPVTLRCLSPSSDSSSSLRPPCSDTVAKRVRWERARQRETGGGRERERQTHRHTDTQTNRQTHRHADTQTHKHTSTSTQTHRHIDTQTHRCDAEGGQGVGCVGVPLLRHHLRLG
eukprot:3567690-Rhodomonas_salina.1